MDLLCRDELGAEEVVAILNEVILVVVLRNPFIVILVVFIVIVRQSSIFWITLLCEKRARPSVNAQ